MQLIAERWGLPSILSWETQIYVSITEMLKTRSHHQGPEMLKAQKMFWILQNAL